MKHATDYLTHAHAAMTLADIPKALSAAMRRDGVPHAPAQKGENGLCLTCGCGLLCPGVHTLEEIQDAARKEAKRT